MKIDSNNTILKYRAGHFGATSNAGQESLKEATGKSLQSDFNFKSNNPSFKGIDFTKTVDTLTHKIIYSDMDKIAPKIDSVLGGNFFTKTMQKAGLAIGSDNKLQIQDTTLLQNIWRTVKYPVVDMPRDLINAIGRNLFKTEPFSSRAAQKQSEKSLEIVSDILENFANPKSGTKIANGLQFNSDSCLDLFKGKVGANVTKLAKNYSSRDERTLNRMATATVSAIYGAWDFHNISMLQKDNKKEAQKAGLGRFKQEMTRMLLSAGTTFLLMGAFDKYIKHSLGLNVLTIVGGTLLSEVLSRIIHKKPLHRLSPQEAEKIALKQHPELAETLKTSNNKETNDNKLNFKQKLENTKQIFVQFQSKDGRFPAMKCLDENYVAESQAKKKKKVDPKKVILGAFGVASAAYIITSALKGEYKYLKDIKKLYAEHGENIPLDKVSNLIKEAQKRADKFSIFKPVKKFLTTRPQTIRLDELSAKLEELKVTESGNQIKEILKGYQDKIRGVIESKGNEFEIRNDMVLPKGIYNGFSRLLGNVYTILSFPARAVNGILKDKVFQKENAAIEAVKAKLPFESNLKNEFGALVNILRKYTSSEDAAKEIANATRKFESGPETGELAGLARTLVTAISTYFFVNDYANSVLIESAGKDTQRAKEEQNERLAHKASNFVINGTLMNLFNSVFVKPLNASLLGATLVATATETTNEFFVRKTICQPVLPKNSRQEIIDYEQKQASRKGLLGAWSKFYRKITGKKSLTEKTKIENKNVK